MAVRARGYVEPHGQSSVPLPHPKKPPPPTPPTKSSTTHPPTAVSTLKKSKGDMKYSVWQLGPWKVINSRVSTSRGSTV